MINCKIYTFPVKNKSILYVILTQVNCYANNLPVNVTYYQFLSQIPKKLDNSSNQLTTTPILILWENFFRSSVNKWTNKDKRTLISLQV